MLYEGYKSLLQLMAACLCNYDHSSTAALAGGLFDTSSTPTISTPRACSTSEQLQTRSTNGGIIAGAVVATLLLVALPLAILTAYCTKRRYKKRHENLLL